MLPVEQLVETAGCEGALLLWVRCAAWRGGLPEEAAAAVDWATVFGWSGAALRALLRAYGESEPNPNPNANPNANPDQATARSTSTSSSSCSRLTLLPNPNPNPNPNP